ncbi:MAG: hypothetical protein V3V40_06480 [Nitrosomonadaceae bacterium]
MTKHKIPDFVVNSDYSEELFIQHVKKLRVEHGYVCYKMSTGKQRTKRQNAALHVYFTLLAEALNDAGYDLRRFFELRPKIDIPWDDRLVKKELWKPLQEVVLEKESTAEADTCEYTKVYEVLNRFTASKFGVHVPWPGYKFECPKCKSDRWGTVNRSGIEYGLCNGFIKTYEERPIRCQFTWKRSDDKSILKYT